MRSSQRRRATVFNGGSVTLNGAARPCFLLRCGTCYGGALSSWGAQWPPLESVRDGERRKAPTFVVVWRRVRTAVIVSVLGHRSAWHVWRMRRKLCIAGILLKLTAAVPHRKAMIRVVHRSCFVAALRVGVVCLFRELCHARRGSKTHGVESRLLRRHPRPASLFPAR